MNKYLLGARPCFDTCGSLFPTAPKDPHLLVSTPVCVPVPRCAKFSLCDQKSMIKVMVCHLTRPLLNGDFDCFQTLFITVLQQTSLDVIDIS